MNRDQQEYEWLHSAFTSLCAEHPPSSSRIREACRQSSRIWQAAAGELSFQETNRIIDHLAQCPRCSQSWLMAREIQIEMPPSKEDHWRLPRPAAALATAAAMLLAAGLYLWDPFDAPPSPRLRGVSQTELKFSITETTPLQREHCRLEWTLPGAGPGVRYRVQVMTLDLEPVDSAHDLTEPEYTIPAERLSRLPDGTALVWRVDAVREDGSRIANHFVARLQ